MVIKHIVWTFDVKKKHTHFERTVRNIFYQFWCAQNAFKSLFSRLKSIQACRPACTCHQAWVRVWVPHRLHHLVIHCQRWGLASSMLIRPEFWAFCIIKHYWLKRLYGRFIHMDYAIWEFNIYSILHSMKFKNFEMTKLFNDKIYIHLAISRQNNEFIKTAIAEFCRHQKIPIQTHRTHCLQHIFVIQHLTWYSKGKSNCWSMPAATRIPIVSRSMLKIGVNHWVASNLRRLKSCCRRKVRSRRLHPWRNLKKPSKT